MALIEVAGLERTFVVRKRSGGRRRTSTVVPAVHDLSFGIEAGRVHPRILGHGRGADRDQAAVAPSVVVGAGVPPPSLRATRTFRPSTRE